MTRLKQTRRNTATNPHMRHETIRSMMALLLATMTILLGLVGCSTADDDDTWSRHKESETEAPSAEELIRQRIKAFVTGLNNGDESAVLDCFDAEMRQEIDVSLDESFTNGFFIKLKGIDVREIDNGSAVATATLEITESGMVSDPQALHIDMTYENGGWYIHDMHDEP